MARRYRLGLMAVILLAVCGFGTRSFLEAQVVDGKSQPRFTKASDGVITDHLTALDWYVNPNPDQTFREAKAWAEGLTVAGGAGVCPPWRN